MTLFKYFIRNFTLIKSWSRASKLKREKCGQQLGRFDIKNWWFNRRQKRRKKKTKACQTQDTHNRIAELSPNIPANTKLNRFKLFIYKTLSGWYKIIFSYIMLAQDTQNWTTEIVDIKRLKKISKYYQKENWWSIVIKQKKSFKQVY